MASNSLGANPVCGPRELSFGRQLQFKTQAVVARMEGRRGWGVGGKCGGAKPKVRISTSDLRRASTCGRESECEKRGCHVQELRYRSVTHRFVRFPMLRLHSAAVSWLDLAL